MTTRSTTESPEGPDAAAWTRHSWPHTMGTAAAARTHLRAALQLAGIHGEIGAEAELILTELITNAIRHGAPDGEGNIDVAWSLRGDRLVLSVHDSGRATGLVAGDLQTTGVAGRGLALVNALSDRWAWNTDDGTQVAAELFLSQPSLPGDC